MMSSSRAAAAKLRYDCLVVLRVCKRALENCYYSTSQATTLLGLYITERGRVSAASLLSKQLATQLPT